MTKSINLFELKKIQSNFPKNQITNTADVNKFIRQFYGDDLEIYESMFLLMLNRKNDTIGYAKISQGGISGTVVDVRIIAKYAIESLASSIILCHNHPSGNVNPSPQDIAITEKIKNAFTFFDIQVLDHIILTADNYYSFADEGKL